MIAVNGERNKSAAGRLATILLDALWLLALAGYAFAGMNLVPLHGDEPEHLHSSADFATYFLQGRPDLLAVAPPYPADSDAYVRIQTGTVTDYLFGVGWSLAGYTAADLPPTWTWWSSYRENVALGSVPKPAILAIGRGISTWLFVFSVAALFGLTRQIGRRWMAYLASGLYAVNPIVLLNSRRAMTEGALFCFGVVTLFLALTIIRRRMHGRSAGWVQWAGLGLCAALAVAAKFSGIIFVAVALAWVALAALSRAGRRPITEVLGGLALTTLIGAAVFLALTPALWRDPVARFGDLIQFHKAVLDGIASDLPSGATTLPERLGRIVTVPFIAPPSYFESPSWAGFKAIAQQVSLYSQSWLHGLELGPLAGGALTGLALAGLVSLLLPRALSALRLEDAAGLALWYAAMAANSLMNPLPWDRYDMLMTPVTAVLAGVGIWQIARLVSRARRPAALSRLNVSS